MNDRIDRERYMPTASTVNGVNLQGPDPVCMFYFAYPFGGIATPASIDPFAGMSSNRTPSFSKCKQHCIHQHKHLRDFVPWPRQTWQSQDALTPLIVALQQQIDQNISEFEKVLRTTRELWYAPSINTNITDVQYLQNYYAFIQRKKQLNEQNFDYILNWRQNSSVPLNVKHCRMESNAFASNELIRTDNSRKIEKPMVINGTHSTAIMSNRKPYTKLLRRRHSLPEIIMRKHQLASQNNSLSHLNASTALSPPARERVPTSFESSRERTRTSSPISVSLTSSSSTIVANDYHPSAGSDSNLNRIYPSNGSMRQQLLRRLWHKEYLRLERTGSLSPPIHRSLRSKRPFRIIENNSPDVCSECRKLEGENFNRSVPEITMKRIKHNSFPSIKTQSTATSVALPRKSYSIETETLNGNSIMSSDSSSNRTRTTPLTGGDLFNGHFNPTINTADSVISRMLSDVNNSTVSTSDQFNGNDKKAQNPTENSFLIEMESDRINVTTMASAESTAISERPWQVSSDDSSIQQHNQSIISRSQKHWHRNDMDEHTSNNNNNNNNNNNPEPSRSNANHMDNLNNNVNGTADSMERTYDAYYIDGDSNTENESSVRLITNETVDQSTLDTIISQILVDSLNNIIVVQGNSLNESNIESNSNSNQTKTTDNNISNASSTSSSLPLPTTDQIYFPHYLSTETLSEYSTKLSNDSSAIELLPSNLVISVISGSSYPLDGGEMIIHRLTDMPRTESMEVQPSSAHSRRGQDKNGNYGKTAVPETLAEDDAVSLVDSLDNPDEINDPIDLDVSMVGPKSASIERSQAFFIPMENAEKSNEIAMSLCQHQSSGLEAVIANSLPSHLRKRLERRQMEINARKETELKQRQDKIQKLIHRHKDTKSTTIANKETKSSFQIIQDESSTETVNNLAGQPKAVPMKKYKSKELRTEIGSLEAYTVDAQGNLQFIEPDAKRNGRKKVTTVSEHSVKHVAIKKTITTKTISAVKQDLESEIMAKRTADNNNRTKQTTDASLNRVKESDNKTEDIQKMTLVHHSPSHMITPDNDCGPRRMYQKTEICEGTKRIEILEIVECLNSSSDTSNPMQSSTSSTASQSCALVERVSAKQSSKIPIPVPIKNRSRSQQTMLNATQRRSLRAQIRDSMHTGNNINKSTVDRIIADLLIEALNNSTDIGIEFIKCPQNLPSQSIIQMNGNHTTKRMNLSTRRTGNVNVGSGKRSAHSTAKYQQVFDAIPEEKSNSLSIDSPSEENCLTPAVESISENSSKSHTMEKTNDLVAENEAPTNGPIKVANGKAAIDSDNGKTAETWFGFFGRTHVDSPIDGMLLLDEESKDKKTDASSTTDCQLDSNEVISSNVSPPESKNSIVTSIPSEALGAKVTSVESDSILPIIDYKFETCVTGVQGGNAAVEKQYRKNAVAQCSAQNHSEADCPECDAIEKELQQNDRNQIIIIENGEPQEAKESKQEINLQLAINDKCDPIETNNLSPISVYSAQNKTLLATNNISNSSMGSGIDCKSFIILHDENENASHFLPNITSTGTEYSTTRDAFHQTKPLNTPFNRPCDDCCFCNTNLHQSRRNANEGQSPKKCNFCSSRQQSNQTTPANSSQFQIKNNEPVNIDSGRSSTAAKDRIYERKYKSSHTHIRTHSRDSNTINTQCTKKTARLIRRSMLNGIDDTISNENLDKTQLFGKTEKKNSNIELNASKNTTKSNNSKTSSIPKLPPHTQNDWHTVETSPSSSSSLSTESSNNKSVRRQNSKSVPNLPKAERWLNIDTIGNGIAKNRTNSRYQEFYGNNGNDEPTERGSADSKSKPAGWTVTVAGTYCDNMAPDVQMHLCFPKRSSIQENKQKVFRTNEHSKQQLIEQDIRSNHSSSKDEIYFDCQRTDKKPAILPPPHSIKLNPKRSLTKTNIFGMDQHAQNTSNRKFIYDANGNANTLNQRSANEICYLPNVYQHRLNNNNQTDRTFAKPSTTKKTIKRSEYSVSVASATTTTTTTTRTMPNFANGKRAMSYQALNANAYRRFQNPNKSKGIPVRRDHSAAELGQSTYRVSATPSPQQSSSYYTPTTLDLGDEIDSNGNPAKQSCKSCKHLSVSGNAIAPERKPPVPTMSERDVTRRHDACFTRTRSIFL